MPTYTYQCRECQATLDETLPMDDRDALVGLPCPECGTGTLERPFVLNAPTGVPVFDRSKCIVDGKHPEGFLDNLRKCAASPGVKGTAYADRLNSRFSL